MSKQKKEAFSSLYVECTHMHTHTKKKKNIMKTRRCRYSLTCLKTPSLCDACLIESEAPRRKKQNKKRVLPLTAFSFFFLSLPPCLYVCVHDRAMFFFFVCACVFCFVLFTAIFFFFFFTIRMSVNNVASSLSLHVSLLSSSSFFFFRLLLFACLFTSYFLTSSSVYNCCTCSFFFFPIFFFFFSCCCCCLASSATIVSFFFYDSVF